MKKVSKNNLPQKPVNCISKNGEIMFGNLFPDDAVGPYCKNEKGQKLFGIVAYETTQSVKARVKALG